MQLEHSHMPLAKKKKEIQINCINEELMLGYTQAQQSQVWREKLYEQICFQ